jgi:hypothetical protein
MMILTEDIYKAWKSQKVYTAVFMDVAGAFNNVQSPPHKVARPIKNFHLDAPHLLFSRPCPLARSHLWSPTPVPKPFYRTQKSCASLHLLTRALNHQQSPRKWAEVKVPSPALSARIITKPSTVAF